MARCGPFLLNQSAVQPMAAIRLKVRVLPRSSNFSPQEKNTSQVRRIAVFASTPLVDLPTRLPTEDGLKKSSGAYAPSMTWDKVRRILKGYNKLSKATAYLPLCQPFRLQELEE
jgi:hypothetical protein